MQPRNMRRDTVKGASPIFNPTVLIEWYEIHKKSRVDYKIEKNAQKCSKKNAFVQHIEVHETYPL